MSSSSTMTGHQLTLRLCQGKDVKPSNYFSSTASDSFITVSTKNLVTKNSSVQYATCSPAWNESIVLDLEENPLDDVIFLTLWGKHIISRNTFLGRIEIPVSAVVDCDAQGKPVKGQRNIRWFKLLPKAGNTQFDKLPGRLELGFSYNYIPVQEEFAMMGELPVTMSASPPAAPQPAKQLALPAPPSGEGSASDPNSKLFFKCPLCQQLFNPDSINMHMMACKAKMAAQQQPAAAPSAPPAPTYAPEKSPQDKLASAQQSHFVQPSSQDVVFGQQPNPQAASQQQQLLNQQQYEQMQMQMQMQQQQQQQILLLQQHQQQQQHAGQIQPAQYQQFAYGQQEGTFYPQLSSQ